MSAVKLLTDSTLILDGDVLRSDWESLPRFYHVRIHSWDPRLVPICEQKLQRCPFCDDEPIPDPQVSNELHFLVCSACGAEGPIAADRQDAVDAWNKRPGCSNLYTPRIQVRVELEGDSTACELRVCDDDPESILEAVRDCITEIEMRFSGEWEQEICAELDDQRASEARFYYR